MAVMESALRSRSRTEKHRPRLSGGWKRCGNAAGHFAPEPTR
ncbi:MAG: hypothetical protein ACI4WV_06305 [Eubacteriales bacterium]